MILLQAVLPFLWPVFTEAMHRLKSFPCAFPVVFHEVFATVTKLKSSHYLRVLFL